MRKARDVRRTAAVALHGASVPTYGWRDRHVNLTQSTIPARARAAGAGAWRASAPGPPRERVQSTSASNAFVEWPVEAHQIRQGCARLALAAALGRVCAHRGLPVTSDK